MSKNAYSVAIASLSPIGMTATYFYNLILFRKYNPAHNICTYISEEGIFGCPRREFRSAVSGAIDIDCLCGAFLPGTIYAVSDTDTPHSLTDRAQIASFQICIAAGLSSPELTASVRPWLLDCRVVVGCYCLWSSPSPARPSSIRSSCWPSSRWIWWVKKKLDGMGSVIHLFPAKY